jgi:hypothetical protein
MFQRIEKNEKSDGYCFVVWEVKGSDLELKLNIEDIYGRNHADFILKMLSEYPANFQFYEKLEFDHEIKNFPEGMENMSKNDIIKNNVPYRYSAEFTMSLKDMQSLIDGRTSEWEGKQIINNHKVKAIQNTLYDNLVGVFIDVQNEQTKTWSRFQPLKLPYSLPNLLPKHKGSCSIM